jgi:glycosyltransferase involved in cell wall biosynthesis
MNLVALSQVKNEIDVIELFVRHTLEYVDGMFIVDNASSDGTREVLADLAARGAPIGVIDDARTMNLQSQRMTALYRRAIRTFDVDFLFLLDADEFLRADSRSVLERALVKLPPGTFGRIPWQTYVMRPEDARAEGDLLRRIRWRRKVEETPFEKVVMPASAEWAERAIIAFGSHAVRTDRGEKLRDHGAPLEGVSLAHFPVRSVEQITTKVIAGWISHLARAHEERGRENYHWHDMYRLILERRLSIDDASRLSMNYAKHGDLLTPFSPEDLVEDPVRSDVPPALAGPRREVDPLLSVARAAVAALSDIPPEPRARGRVRGWNWRRGGRKDVEALGMAPSPEAGAAALLRDRFRPRSILALGTRAEAITAWLCERGAERIVHGADLENPHAGDPFDLVIAHEVGESLPLDECARLAAGPILYSCARGALSQTLDRFEALGFAVDGWLSASLAVLAAPGSRRPPPILLVRKGRETPGPFGRATLKSIGLRS